MIPIEVDPDEARDAAVRELSDPAYQVGQPSWFDRAMRWILDRLGELTTPSFGPGGLFGLLVIVLLIVAIVVVIRLRSGKIARTRRHGAQVFGAGVRTADDHRRAAEQAAAAGAFGDAIRERFRAIVRELEQRGVLDVVDGRTVDEIATQAGRVLPEVAPELRAVARIFDDVVYGDRPATVDGYRRVGALDDRVRAQRPALLGASR
jgi:hypothetical protein